MFREMRRMKQQCEQTEIERILRFQRSIFRAFRTSPLTAAHPYERTLCYLRDCFAGAPIPNAYLLP